MIKQITSANFRRYGRIIEYPNKKSKSAKANLFRIVLTEPKIKGWRIAYLIVRDKTIKRLEHHPDSFESFEPIKGKSLLYVSTQPDPKTIECFYLNSPVILKKGIWHGIVTLSKESEMKLTENAKVQCVYWPLGFKLGRLHGKNKT